MSSVERKSLYDITPLEIDMLYKECDGVAFCFDEETKTLRVQDRWGRIFSGNSLKTIVKGLNNFLETFDDQYIKEHNQVIDKEIQKEIEDSRNFVPVKQRQPKPGFVFLYQELAAGLYRFAETTNIKSRVKGIKNSLQVDFDIVHLIECDDIDKVKEYFCNKFSDKLNEKNWYVLSMEDMEIIKKKEHPPEIAELIISER